MSGLRWLKIWRWPSLERGATTRAIDLDSSGHGRASSQSSERKVLVMIIVTKKPDAFGIASVSASSTCFVFSSAPSRTCETE